MCMSYISTCGHSILYHTEFDECVNENGGCEQRCVNQLTSFECDCYDGYMLDSNGLNCSGE